MAMLDDEFGGLMDDPSTQPGGAQERFIMGLLGNAAGKKGYASLGLPLLSLLLRDQMQGFDAERKKQAQMAQVAKVLQAKRLQTQMEHEQQKMGMEQEQAQLQRSLPQDLMRQIEEPGIGGPAIQTDVGDNPIGLAFGRRGLNPQEQAVTAARAYPNAAPGLLRDMLEPLKAQKPNMADIQAEIVEGRSRNVTTGKLDLDKAEETIKKLRTNPEGTEGRLFDGYVRNGMTEIEAAEKVLSFKRDAALQGAEGRTQGALNIRNTPEFKELEKEIASIRALAGAQGRRQVEAQEKLLNLSGLKFTVDKIGELSEVVPAGEPGIGRFTTGGMNWANQLMQTDENVVELDRMSKAYANILNRSLLAERGVITDRDREFAVDMIPSIWDTLAIRRRKMTGFKAMTEMLVWGEEQLTKGALNVNEFKKRFNALKANPPQPAKETAPSPKDELPPPPPGWK